MALNKKKIAYMSIVRSENGEERKGEGNPL